MPNCRAIISNFLNMNRSLRLFDTEVFRATCHWIRQRWLDADISRNPITLEEIRTIHQTQKGHTKGRPSTLEPTFNKVKFAKWIDNISVRCNWRLPLKRNIYIWINKIYLRRSWTRNVDKERSNQHPKPLPTGRTRPITLVTTCGPDCGPTRLPSAVTPFESLSRSI